MGGAKIVMHGQQSMQAGDSDIEESGDRRAKGLRRHGGFFADGNVTGAGTDDGNAASRRRSLYGLAQRYSARCGVVTGGGMLREQRLGGCGIDARRENVYAIRRKRGEDGNDLLGSFACAEDDFRQAGAQTAVVIDTRVPRS
jgi:hypothetical protein